VDERDIRDAMRKVTEFHRANEAKAASEAPGRSHTIVTQNEPIKIQ
jgi:hypothetical protein